MSDQTYHYNTPSVFEILYTMKSLNENMSKIFFFGSVVAYGVIMYDPCTHEQIKSLEENIGYNLPHDYTQFLHYTNGMKFGHDESHLHVSSHLFSLEELYSRKEIFSWKPESMLGIGVCAESTIEIFIKLDEMGGNNIYVTDVMADKFYSRLNCNFRTFLERFILTYGTPYWEWGSNITEIDNTW